LKKFVHDLEQNANCLNMLLFKHAILQPHSLP
jgi:hypothetical protein